MNAARLVERLGGGRRTASGWMVRCPTHDDAQASLSVSDGEKGVVVFCHAGCPPEAILAAAGLTWADLFDHGSGSTREPTITYRYRKTDGSFAFEVVRLPGKQFRARRPDGRWTLDGVERVLYRLPELLAADPGTPVFVVEGEKDADTLAAHGLFATTNVGGAGKWRDGYSVILRDRSVVILPDNDEPGRRHAETVARSTGGRIVELPGLPPKGDVSDWLAAGHSVGELLELVTSASSPSGGGETGAPDAIHGELIDVATAREDRRRKQESQASRLAREAWQAADLFHDDERTGYATIPLPDHNETWPIRSLGFRHWITGLLFEQAAELFAPSGQAVRDAIGMCEALAIYRCPQHAVYRRIAPLADGRIVVDLANDAWETLTVGPDGWVINEESPVRFLRADGVLALPYPEHGGSIDELRPFLNVTNEDSWRLIVGWLVMAFRPRGPYPVLALSGEQGAAKSTTGRFLRGLVDPNKVADRTMPRDERDLAISARGQWVTNLDNLSHLPVWLSDGLARLSTGAGLSTRQLYTDVDEVRFYAQRPTLMNGITEAITRGDLLDRAILVELAAISSSERRVDTEIRADYAAARPRILGALFDVVAMAIRREHEVHLEHLPRMADFARWVTAAEPALGWEHGSFLASYAANRGAAHEIALEVSPVASALREFVATNMSWEGTAAALLALLSGRVDEEISRRKTWPDAPKALADELRRLAPNLREVGVVVEFKRSHGQRLISITTTGNRAAPEAPTHTAGAAGAAGIPTVVVAETSAGSESDAFQLSIEDHYPRSAWDPDADEASALEAAPSGVSAPDAR